MSNYIISQIWHQNSTPKSSYKEFNLVVSDCTLQQSILIRLVFDTLNDNENL
jgi:hypothetical protein